MAKVLFNLPDQEYAELKKKAQSFGLTTAAFIRYLLKNSKIKEKDDQTIQEAIRRLIPIIVEALGRTQNVQPEAVNKLTDILVKKYDLEEKQCGLSKQ
jgi:hypothetical protein